jgi:hypothetical protein
MYRKITARECRTEVISFRMTAEEKASLQVSADGNKMKLHDYVRHLLVKSINQ